MTDDVMEQMNSVLERLEGRLDSMEKGELPPALAAAQKESKDEKKDEESDSPKEEKKDDEDMEKSEYSDVITS